MSRRKLKRRGLIRLVTGITAAFVVMSGIAFVNYRAAENYKLQVHNSYQRAFSELTTNMSQLDTALSKGLYATSPSIASSLCTDIFGKSTAAQMALSQIPFSHVALENTATFLSKVGDYAYVLSKNASTGIAYGETERTALKTLSENAAILSQNLEDLQAGINDGKITIEELSQAKSELATAEESVTAETLDNRFTIIESEFPEMPTLMYDGPFSEHIGQMESLFLEGKNDVTREQALLSAAKFLDLKPEIFSFTAENAGKMPTYTFSTTVDGGEISVEVTKKGGLVLNLCNSRAVASTDIRPEDAVVLATKFLADRGLASMKESYYTVQGNIITINFAYLQDGVICYPDLVKVALAMDDGRIIGYDASGYIMTHTQRSIPAPQVDTETAQKHVAFDLTVLAHEMTIIPTDGKYEIFCHEFKCATADGQHYLIYVNAVTGEQQKILILVEDENGTLTM